MTLLEAGAVQRQRFVAEPEAPGAAEAGGGQIQHGMDASAFDDGGQAAPERVVIRRGRHAALRQPLRAVAEKLFGASIAEPEELPQDQAGKKLGEGKIVSREPPGVLPEFTLADEVGGDEDPPWRLTGFHPVSCIDATENALPNMRRTFRGLRQSQLRPLFPPAAVLGLFGGVFLMWAAFAAEGVV